jgi:sortase A
MKNKEAFKAKAGAVLTVCGVLMLIAAIALVIFNISDDRRAGDAADRAVEGINEVLEGEDTDTDGATTDVPLYKLYPDMEMHTVELDGNEYIGRLDIPELGLSLPVMSKWSYPNLRVSPCRYSGSAYLGDLVIAAHNYNRHFGKIKNLSIGSTIVFTDISNNRFVYSVADIEELAPNAVEKLTGDERGLTLFTCNKSGRKRVAVRCVEVNE